MIEGACLALSAAAVHAFAVAFDGKRVWVKTGGTAAKKKASKGRKRGRGGAR